MPYATANGLDLYWEEEGEGRPVFFIHGGFGGVESSLYPKPSAIAGVLPGDRYRTISFDRRSSGRSQYATAPARLEDLAADAYGLIEGLGVRRCIVLGDSLGGMIAMQLALDYPHSVEGLVLMETSARVLPRPPRVQALIVAMRLLGPRLLYRMFRRRFLEPDWSKPIGPDLTADGLAAEAAYREDLRARLHSLPDGELYRYSLGLIRTYVAFSGRDLRSDAGRLTIPVHVVHGTADTVVSLEDGRELADLIPNAAMTELAGIGHGLLYYREGRSTVKQVVESMAAATPAVVDGAGR